MNLKEFFTGYKGKDMPSELKEFNWGAFLLTFVWGIKHKAWITLLGIPLIWFQLPFGINWILYTVLQFYSGFKGNMWAYQVDWWMTPKDFRKYQARWAISAVVLNIFIPVVLLAIAGRFIQKDLNNPANFISNTQCSVAYSKLNKEFHKISLNSTVSSADMARSFAKNFKNARAEGENVNFSVKHEGKNVEVYTITFNMYDNASDCKISTQNCSITSSFILPDEINFPAHCQFYFDKDKNFVPDESTQKVLDKGVNIFNYL